MAWARIKFLTPQAKILAHVASPLGQEFLPLGGQEFYSCPRNWLRILYSYDF